MEEEFSATIKEYQTVLESVDKNLTTIITNDRFLNDLIPKSDHESEFVNLPINREVMNAIEIHFGRAMRLTLLRGDGVRLPLVVPVDARVLELRWAVQDAVTSYMNHLHSASNLPKDNRKEDSADCIPSSNIPSKSISWRNLWKTKCLALVNPHSLCSSEGLPSISARLDVLTNKLSYYQIRNGAVITFAPQLKRK
ncbi:unnamed protein product [Schistosoma margrebowiei]|uniref:DHC_N1 domain-containing protein n=1 Tax=Schistosoma margrebowiei TaxID=48269 RepID=A0A183LLJ3_9TREM|nr:unnamed protein product [Schistosoma margrebowiei]VDO62650.1 unnamed protein product [Schistosoma margrebowiei]